MESTAGTAGGGGAADGGEVVLQEVVVTAQKRSENLQNVPIAVSTLNADQLAQGDVEDITDLKTVVPGLLIINANSKLNTSLRGVGSNGVAPGFENPIAIYVDGVYYASTVANFLNLDNIAQVEVLKGPQGTLFGRNATGGLVQITTRTPTQQTAMDGTLSYGNFDTSTASFYLGGGLAPNLAADLSVYATHRGDGWGENLHTGARVNTIEHDYTVRSKWVWDAGRDTRFTLIGDYSNSSGTPNSVAVVPGTISGFAPQLGPAPDLGYDVDSDAPNYKEGFAAGVSLMAQQNLGVVSLSSITAYRNSRYSNRFELDGGPLDLANAEDNWPDSQFSEELQIQSRADLPLTWQAGVYYFNDVAAYAPIFLHAPYLGVNLTFDNKQSTDSIAGYAQGTYHFSEGTNLTLGGRYTSETREAYDGSTSTFVLPLSLQLPPELAPDEKATFDKFNYRVSLDQRLSKEWMVYVSTSTGFKSGGFNTGSPGTPAYRPENLTAYEVGTKGDLLNERLRWNNAIYYYDYKDLQTQVLVTSGVISIANAASAHIYGWDSDLQVLVTEAFRLNGAFAYNHATYVSYPDALLSSPMGGVNSTVGSAKGNYLPFAPKYTLNLGGDYTFKLPAGSLNLAANAYYNDGYFFEADNVIRQGSFVDLAANLKWTLPGDHYWVGLYGKNLTDKRTIGYATTQSNGTHLLEWAAPRTYGVTVGASLQ